MKIFKLKIKSHNQDSVEKVVVETDIPNAVQSFIDKVSKHSVTNITITPLGDMPDEYVTEKFRPKVLKAKSPSVSVKDTDPPF